MAKMRWRLWLPISQLTVAIGLSLLGKAETERRLAGSFQVWDYMAPAEMVLHSINYPAVIATELAVRNRTFQIGPEYSFATFGLYLVFVVILWYVVGALIENSVRSSSERTRPPLWVAALGVVAGLILLLAALAMLRGPYALLLLVSAFVWSGAILVSSAIHLVIRALGARHSVSV